jgi:hypothetical protein
LGPDPIVTVRPLISRSGAVSAPPIAGPLTTNSPSCARRTGPAGRRR